MTQLSESMRIFENFNKDAFTTSQVLNG